MKTIIVPIITTALSMSAVCYAADWTPAFNYLVVGKKGDNGEVLNAMTKNTFRDGISEEYFANNETIPKQLLTPMAQSGNFTVVKAPFRADILPVKTYTNRKNEFITAVYPLKNATLFGRPLQSITYHLGCFGCGHVGFYATFKPMTNKQYQQLVKSVKFKKDSGEDGCVPPNTPLAGFHREGKTVHLVLDVGC